MSRQRRELNPDEVAFYTHAKGDLFWSRIGEGSALRTGGYGGWEDVARPGLTAATRFVGGAPAQLTIPIIIGKWPPGRVLRTCEDRIRKLERIARKDPRAPRSAAPPVFRVRGAVPHGGLIWFVEDVQWGDVVVYSRQRVRAAATVVLREYVRVDLVVLGAGKGGKGRFEIIRARRGENLRQFAQRTMKVEGRRAITLAARLLREINGIRDPSRLEPGQRIKVPKT